MQVAILMYDHGDGTAHLTWFKSVELARRVLACDDFNYAFGINAGNPSTITVGDDWAPEFGFDDETFEGFDESA